MESTAPGGSVPGQLAGLTLAIGTLAIVATVTLAAAATGRLRHRRAAAAAVLGLGFQVVHVLEHVAQLVYWTTHRYERPWMSPWAMETVRGLGWWAAPVAPGVPQGALGVELLHLFGNVIFLAGIVGLGLAGASGRSLRWARRIQIAHVAEHVALTTTLVAGGTARGLSTAFGAAQGPTLTALRVWFHFSINAAATALAAVALVSYLRREYRRRRALDTSSFKARVASATSADRSEVVFPAPDRG